MIPLFVFFITFISPGCLILISKNLVPLEKISFLPLISVVSNGLVYAVARDLRILDSGFLSFYFLLLTLILIFVIYKSVKDNYFTNIKIGSILEPLKSRKHLITLAIIVFFALVSLYYSGFFPPWRTDAIYYHLPIPQSAANGTYFEYLTQGGVQESAFKSISTCFEMFYYPFFKLDSSLYRIIPSFFGILLLLQLVLFMKKLKIKSQFVALGTFFAAFSPIIMVQSSVHFVDLPLTCFSVGVAYFLFKHLTEGKKEWLYFAGVLGGLGGLVKPPFFYFFVPLLLFELFYYRLKEAEFQKIDFLAYVKSSFIFLSFSVYFILRRVVLVSNGPPWPGALQKISFETVMPPLSKGIVSSITPTKEGFLIIVLLIGIYSLYKLTSNLWQKNFTSLGFLKIIILGWVTASILGATLLYKSPRILNNLPRFLLPVYPLLIIVGVKELEDFSKSLESISIKIMFLILLVGTLLTPLFQTVITSDHHNYITSRYGEITYRPLANDEEKLDFLLGQKYKAWEYVNSQYSNSKARVLSDGGKVFYLKPFVYLPPSIPNRYSPDNILEWWTQENIKWIITSHENGPLDKYLKRNENFVELVYDPEGFDGYRLGDRYTFASIKFRLLGVELLNSEGERLKVLGSTLWKGFGEVDFKVFKVSY